MRLGVFRVVLFAAVMGVLASSGSARADHIPPPPQKCPKGQRGISSHRGQECCRPNGTCYSVDQREVRLPVEEPAPRGIAVPAEPSVSRSANPAAPLPASSSAAPPSASSAPASSGGCHKGCAVSSTPAWFEGFALPLLVGAAFWRRRRPRGHSEEKIEALPRIRGHDGSAGAQFGAGWR